MERSLVLIKPDAVQRGLIGSIISSLEGRGLKLVALKMLHLNKALAQRHYAVHRDKPFFKDLVDYITSGPIVALVFEGEGTVELIKTKIKDEAEEKGIPIQVRMVQGEVCYVMGNPVELKEVLFNIVLNSIDAMHQGGTISLQTRRENGTVSIKVSDEGIGIQIGRAHV